MFAALVLATALSADATSPTPPGAPIKVRITPLPEPLVIQLPDAAPPPALTPAPRAVETAVVSDTSLWRGLAGPLFLILIAGGAAWHFRRKSSPSKLIQILETASLGPKRSLIVARIGDETLVLGSSEAGIQLLTTHSLETPEPEAAPLPEPLQFRPRPQAPAPRTQSFEDLLDDTQEDLALRRKLAAGFSGRVP